MGPTKWSQEHRLIAGADYTWNEGSGYDTTLHFSIVRIQVDLIVMLIIVGQSYLTETTMF